MAWFSGNTHQPPPWPPCLQFRPSAIPRRFILNVTLLLRSSKLLLSSTLPKLKFKLLRILLGSLPTSHPPSIQYIPAPTTLNCTGVPQVGLNPLWLLGLGVPQSLRPSFMGLANTLVLYDSAQTVPLSPTSRGGGCSSLWCHSPSHTGGNKGVSWGAWPERVCVWPWTRVHYRGVMTSLPVSAWWCTCIPSCCPSLCDCVL